MADKKKTTKKIAVSDVTPADKVASATSARPIIVTNRPIMKDPMMVDADKKDPDDGLKAKPLKPVLKPDLPEPEKTEAETPEPEPKETPDDPEQPAEGDKPAKPTPAETEEADAAKRAEHDKAVQKLVDDKQFFLPINAVEKRRSRRFVLLGVLLSLVLAIAWVDVALDAGLIQIGNVKPVTHFFSN